MRVNQPSVGEYCVECLLILSPSITISTFPKSSSETSVAAASSLHELCGNGPLAAVVMAVAIAKLTYGEEVVKKKY